jgi:predicted transcriptional regulator YheO
MSPRNHEGKPTVRLPEPTPSNVPAPRSTADGDRLLSLFSGLVPALGAALPPGTELVLHDLSLLPNSIVAVAGTVTGRRPGDPATNLLLEEAVSGFHKDSMTYETRLADGRSMRSSTSIVRDIEGHAVAALCINSEVVPYSRPVPRGEEPESASGVAASPEVFVRDVDELASYLLTETIRTVGVPVELMKKEHKIGVVAELQRRGMFLLRSSAEMVAEALGVTRFTVYNYLSEVNSDEPHGGRSDADAHGTGSEAEPVGGRSNGSGRRDR